MYISLDWLSDFTKLPKLTAQEIGEKITLHTAEVEGVEDLESKYANMVIGRIVELKKHPDADRLNLTMVDIGESKPVQIVCGGQNLQVDMLVPIGLPGAKVDVHGSGDIFELAKVKIRGAESHGMICAGEEIWMEPDNEPNRKKDVKITDLSHLNEKPGTPLAKALGKSGSIIDIDNKSLTHRPDLWNHYGFARECSTIFKQELKPYEPKAAKPDSTEAKPKATIKDDKVCPQFSMAIMTGIEIAESPQWMKSRLEAAGMNPHNNIVDITNYVMLELGQPMHAYDRKVVGSDELIIRTAKDGEILVTLDESEYKLNKEDPIVCDKKNEPLGIAGIKGGLKSGITDETTEIIVEAANWDPIIVRKCSTRIGLRTDASQRFEKGLDPSMTETAVNRAIELIKELSPNAKLISKVETFGKWKPGKKTIKVSPEKICKKIGVEISEKEMTRILKSLEFGVKKSGKQLEVDVPSHRATGDVDIPDDIVEEIARIHGYDQVPALVPSFPINLPVKNEERFHKHDARRILAHNLGFTEDFNYSFYGEDRLEACGLDETKHLKILNYLSEDQTHMRTSMTPNLLASIAKNAREFEHIKLFEIGRTYEENGAYMPDEKKVLAAAISSKSKDEIFYEIKGALEAFLQNFQTGNYKLVPSKDAPSYAHPKKCMTILSRGKQIGHVFAVHPGVLKHFDIAHQVGMFELHFNALVEHGRNTVKFEEPSKFPAMNLDVSVLMEEEKTVAAIESAIRKTDKEKSIQNIELFDIYRGKEIPENQKAMAFTIQLRHKDRTLTDKEFQETQEAIFLALEKLGGKIRGRN